MKSRWLYVAIIVGAIGFGVGLGVARWATGQEQNRDERIEQVAREADALAQRIVREGRGRRDQSCTQSEREHLNSVGGLKRTYRFLRSPKAREDLGPGLVRLIVQQLPRTEQEARTDVAPKFCDEPGIGLPEPDPTPPERRDFSHLLK